MRIAQYHSHLNGLEFLQVHKPKLWTEIKQVIASTNTRKSRTGGPLSPTLLRGAIGVSLGERKWESFNQTHFVKDRVAIEVQFGKYFAVAYDLFVKHLAFYIGDIIDVGIEIVPMKSFAASTVRKSGKRARNMSTGVPWYEKELYNLIREGRGVPGVPLVIVGIEP